MTLTETAAFLGFVPVPSEVDVQSALRGALKEEACLKDSNQPYLIIFKR